MLVAGLAERGDLDQVLLQGGERTDVLERGVGEVGARLLLHLGHDRGALHTLHFAARLTLHASAHLSQPGGAEGTAKRRQLHLRLEHLLPLSGSLGCDYLPHLQAE